MIKTLLLFFLFIMLLPQVFAQVESPPLADDEVYVYNQSYMDITIFIRLRKNRWKRINMEAESSFTIKVNKGKAMMKIPTTGLQPLTILYQIEGGKKYDIFWYASKMRLDIAEFKPNYNWP